MDRLQDVRSIFNEVLEPLYGSQDKAVKQIEESSDRRCFLLYQDADPVAVLQFKAVATSEFQEFGAAESIEIKSLFVYNPQRNSGKGLASRLLEKLKEELPRLGIDFNGIHVTVSERVAESLLFFKKKGFGVVHTWDGRYIPGVKEHLLFYPWRHEAHKGDKELASDMPIPPLLRAPTFTRNLSRGVSATPMVVDVIQNAHYGDIHDIKRLSDNSIVSSSKDNCIYKWDLQGNLLMDVLEVDASLSTDQDWITAVAVLNDNYWASGARNGRVTLWRTDGSRVKELSLQKPKIGHVADPKNVRRVTCLAAGLDAHNPVLYAGYPTLFDEYSLIEGRTSSCTTVHRNDWAYCIEPVTSSKLLVVVGCDIGVWEKLHGAEWARTGFLVNASADRARPRPFISSLTPLESKPDRYVYSTLRGTVTVLDAERGAVVHEYLEHSGNVWKTVSMSEHVAASCGADRSIKLWDLRLERSVGTISGHLGPVTALLALDGRRLVAGTCPADPVVGAAGAQLVFYDVR